MHASYKWKISNMVQRMNKYETNLVEVGGLMLTTIYHILLSLFCFFFAKMYG